MSKKKKKYYVVWNGRRPGIYNNWPDADASVDGYKDNQIEGFKTYEEAVAAYAMTYDDFRKNRLASKRPPLEFPALW